MTEFVNLEISENVALLRMTHGVTNGITAGMVREIKEALQKIRSDARAMILAGGDKFFSMGLHLPGLLELDRAAMLEFYQAWNEVCLELYTLPMPTVAAIKGHAPAGGTIMALTCDFRIMASGKPKMGLNEVLIGVAVPYLADLILRQVAGDRVATNMAFNGRLFGADEGLRNGLVDEAYPSEEVEANAFEKMKALAVLPRKGLAANKEARTAFIREQYEKNGRRTNERVLDFWFDPEIRPILAEAAKLF
jgi:enoyl-CoA hydratase/carnithine racemase